jgi:ligand-binding sensor domain-containing protein
MRFYLILLILFFNSQNITGNDFKLSKFSIKDISSNRITSIFKDNDNFFWVGTTEGLNRYDGINNTIYRSNPFNENTINDNSIYKIFQLDDKGIFISTSSGLNFYNNQNFSFKRIQNQSKSIHNFFYNNTLYFTTENNGFYTYNLSKETTSNYKFDPRNPLSITSSSFSEDQNDIILKINNKSSINDTLNNKEKKSTYNNNYIWIGTTNGLNKFSLKTKSSKRFYSNDSPETILSNYIFDIFYDSSLNKKINIDNKILISTDKGISSIQIESNTVNNYSEFNLIPVYNIFKIKEKYFILNKKGVYEILSINDKKINYNEILKFDKNYSPDKIKVINENEFILWTNKSSKILKLSLSDNNIRVENIFNDKKYKINDLKFYENEFFISTNQGIIHLYYENDFIKPFIINEIKNEKIISSKIYKNYKTILTNKNLYIYLENNLIKKYKSSLFKINDSSFDIPLIFYNEFLAIGSDKLYSINLINYKTTVYEPSEEGFNSIMNGAINNLGLINNNLWISLNSGISIFDINEKRFSNYKFNVRSKNKFPNGFSSILQPKNKIDPNDKSINNKINKSNELWISNINSGLYRYSLNTLELEKQYVFDINDKRSITSSSISKIHFFKNKFYIGSQGDGLYIYTNDSIGFKNFTIEDGLLSNTIIDILSDSNRIFILTTEGINYFEKNKLKSISNEDGLKVVDFIKNGLQFKKNNLYVTSNNLIQEVSINNIFNETKSPKIKLINSLVIDNNFDIYNFKIQENTINLSTDISNVELNFSSPSYYKSNETRLFYRLNPFNNEWIKINSNKNIKIQSSYWSAGYVNNSKIYVPFGNYKLEVKALNSSGIESDEILLYNLNIIAPWYMTTMAIISYIILFIFIIYMYVKYNKDQTKKIMEEKRKEDDLKEARDLQMSLLAKENPSRNDLDISTYIRSSTEVGGDYYDFIELKDGSLLVICGDATGHGTASGMMVSITKAGLLGIDSKDPDLILKNLNTIIKKIDIGRLRMSLNLIHFKNGSIRASSAAMPPIYHYEKINKKVDEIQISNLPLGGLMDENYTVINKKFSKDDVIVMISDGLPEAPNKDGELLDYKLIKECIQKNSYKTAEEIKEDLVYLSDKWLDGLHNPDDITIVVCKKKI